MNKPKWYIKFYNIFMVYLPVLLILSLILMIYFTYIFTYIQVLINTPQNLATNNFIFKNTMNPSNGHLKGIILFWVTLVFTTMLLLCFFRTVLMDPGFFPSPLEIEYNVVRENIKPSLDSKSISKANKKDYVKLNENEDNNEVTKLQEESRNNLKYLTNFGKIVTSGPLSKVEENEIRTRVSSIFPWTQESDSKFLHNEDIISINKQKLMLPKYAKGEFTTTLCTADNSLPNSETAFLLVHEGIDLTKANLCGTCLRMKVERSHHCRQCGRCVLKMDHHCPWLANCIGFKNYKAFCLLHFYGFIATEIISFTFWEVVLNYYLNIETSLLSCWFVTFIYVSNIGLNLFLAWLLYVNTLLVFNGETIIEQSDRERFPRSKAVNTYDMGWKRNFINVFGKNPLFWGIPYFANYKGNGLIYESIGFLME